jgi:hypothetical protein
MNISNNKSQDTINILFLGQCLSAGYEDVAGEAAFPAVAMRLLALRFPTLRFKYDIKYLHHPTGLKALLKHKLKASSPDVAVINLAAMFAATVWRVSLLYQIAPDIVDLARSFIKKLDKKITGTGNGSSIESLVGKTSPWRPTVIHPPVSLDEYERLVEDAITACRGISPCRLVLQGPGRFNQDTSEDYAIHAPELWVSVNQMTVRVGKRFGLPVINTQEALAEYGGDVFLPNNHRFSAYGHEVVAREVESVLASQVKGLRAD